MAGIKRKSAAATQSDVKSKTKKVKVDKPAKRSSDKDAVKPSKSSKKAKRELDSDELMESDTSEVENGFYGFSASKDDVDDEEDSFVGNALEAALEKDAKKEKKKEKKEKKEKDGKKEHKKDKEDKKESKSNGAAPEKPALAGLNCKQRSTKHCFFFLAN